MPSFCWAFLYKGAHMLKSFLLFLFLSVSILYSQESTLVGDNIENGGFGGPVIKFTKVNNEFGVFVGARGGWIMNHKFVIGLGGYGLVNNIKVADLLTKNRLIIGYGGLELEYIINSNDVFHLSIQALLGGGSVTYTKVIDDDWNWDWEHTAVPFETFFIAEPGVNLMLNVTSFFRIGLGASYRIVSDIDYKFLSNKDIDGLSGVLTFKFGSF